MSLVRIESVILASAVVASGSIGESVFALGEPGDLSRDAFAIFEGVGQARSDVGGATYPREKRGLEEARDAKTGRDEDDAKGGMWTEEKVL